jgi:8-oxo-dGTP pyrophosphatase MutT (NUDIX family)
MSDTLFRGGTPSEQLFEPSIESFVLPQTVKALVQQGAGVLLLMKQNGTWDLPGGKLDPDENLDMAMRRELSEEIGMTPATLVFHGEALRHRENRLPVRVSFYRATFKSGWTTGDIILSTEHRELVIADADLIARLPMMDAYRQTALDMLLASG